MVDLIKCFAEIGINGTQVIKVWTLDLRVVYRQCNTHWTIIETEIWLWIYWEYLQFIMSIYNFARLEICQWLFKNIDRFCCGMSFTSPRLGSLYSLLKIVFHFPSLSQNVFGFAISVVIARLSFIQWQMNEIVWYYTYLLVFY